MKKIRKGDVVVITNDTRFYAQIGLVESVDIVSVNVRLGLLSCLSFFHEDLEVIDHIDDETPEPRVGDVVVITDKKMGYYGYLGELEENRTMIEPGLPPRKVRVEDPINHHKILWLHDKQFEVIDHIDEDVDDTGYDNGIKLAPVPEGFVEINGGTVKEGDWVVTKGYCSAPANDLIGCVIPVRNDTGYWKIYRDAKLIRNEKLYQTGGASEPIVEDLVWVPDGFMQPPSSNAPCPSCIVGFRLSSCEGCCVGLNKNKLKQWWDEHDRIKSSVPLPKFKVGDRVIVCGDEKSKGIIDHVFPFNNYDKEFKYGLRGRINHPYYEISLRLDTESVEKSKPKEWSAYNAVTLNGIEAIAELDGTKVIVTCKNCKHVIKTVDLKE